MNIQRGISVFIHLILLKKKKKIRTAQQLSPLVLSAPPHHLPGCSYAPLSLLLLSTAAPGNLLVTLSFPLPSKKKDLTYHPLFLFFRWMKNFSYFFFFFFSGSSDYKIHTRWWRLWHLQNLSAASGSLRKQHQVSFLCLNFLSPSHLFFK